MIKAIIATRLKDPLDLEMLTTHLTTGTSEKSTAARDRPHGWRFPLLSSSTTYVLIWLVIASITVGLIEVTGYYWLVSINWNAYVSYDLRPLQSLAFGILIASVVSFVLLAPNFRTRILPGRQLETLAGTFAVIAALSWYFLVLSYEENFIYGFWILADIIVFLVTFGTMANYFRGRLSRRAVVVALSLALALSASLAVPGYLSATRTTLLTMTLSCTASRCTFGIGDPSIPIPAPEGLVQGRNYNFYFDLVQGRAEIMLTSAPGTGNTTYWTIGAGQGSSKWSGMGIHVFQWSPQTAAFYQFVFLNENYPSSMLVIIRVTVS